MQPLFTFGHRRHALASGLLLLVAVAAAHAASDLPPPLDRALREARLPPDSLGVMVQAVDGATPLIAFNAHTPLKPASTVKLVTTLAALSLLGPTYTWKTEAYVLGTLTNGVLDGDLLFKGGGDPYLVDQSLWKFLTQLRQKGLKDIHGHLLVDDAAFAPPAQDPAAFDGEPTRLYNVQATALMVNFKAVEFRLQPSASDNTVAVVADPPLGNLVIDNQLRTSAAACEPARLTARLVVPDAALAERAVFTGELPARCGEQVWPRTMLSAETYFDGLFRLLWTGLGGRLDGPLARAAAPVGQPPFAVWVSPPLAEVIRPMNKWSNNLMADTLLLTIAAERQGRPATLAAGSAATLRWMQDAGIETNGAVLENGSGLSRQTRFSAATLVGLLRHGWASPVMPEYMASLPLVGLDGTARRHFVGTPEQGHMHLKSGHLDDVVAVGGYVLAQSGRRYAVAVLANGPAVNNGSGQGFINAVLAWTFRQ